MEFGSTRLRRVLKALAPTALALGAFALTTPLCLGGNNNGGGRAVGGVMVNAEGIVRSATVAETQELANVMRAAVHGPKGELAKNADLRMVSLARLQDAIIAARQTGGDLPESIKYMAGLQRVEYVFVDKENNDIVLAGPAEPWKLQADGSVVGTVSGGATLRLDDLVVAMRTVEKARQAGITCSIEPTAEGRARLQQLMKRIKLRPGQNPAYLESSMREAFGPQQILLTGVDSQSRYARTLVAADYEMKRIAMDLSASDVKGLPSYMQMSKNSKQAGATNPRWWMACNYDALQRSEDGTAWKLSGQGVRTETEQDEIAADGTAKASGRKNVLAQKWADLMTEHYTELAKQKPIFSDLRNIMDLTVVATLITQERLAEKAGLDVALYATESDTLETATYAAPTTIAPQCSFIKGRSGWTVTASGGVDVSAFDVVEKQTVDSSVAGVKAVAIASAAKENWWWNK